MVGARVAAAVGAVARGFAASAPAEAAAEVGVGRTVGVTAADGVVAAGKGVPQPAATSAARRTRWAFVTES